MEIVELREKSDRELKKLLAQNHEKLRDLNFRIANKQVKNTNSKRVIKRILAKILTALKEREKESTKG
ncbi:MAG: hypothetical protein ACD_63C00108G0013 [uncultured bacterium]|nr:MAG: hypothetical protein ACD_63C00108G0013 [uncultured bacterium]